MNDMSINCEHKDLESWTGKKFWSHDRRDKRPTTADTIYLAGKVYCGCGYYGKSPDGVKYEIPELITRNDLIFTDSTSEGSCHGNWDYASSHGCTYIGNTAKDYWNTVLWNVIDSSDGMLAYLDQPNSSGTIAEVAYAATRGKPVYVYVKKTGIVEIDRAIEHDYRILVTVPKIESVMFMPDTTSVAEHFNHTWPQRHYRSIAV